jgi:glycosyltransferase involved in cell wall biosynthesis
MKYDLDLCGLISRSKPNKFTVSCASSILTVGKETTLPITYSTDGRIPYLVVVTSSNQLYSGTGAALFEWIKYSRKKFRFTICIDNRIALNYCIARDFCLAEGIDFLPSGPNPRAGAADPGVADAQFHVVSGQWPLIEIVSWANTATNLDVVEAVQPGSRIIFTPHTQPSWTMPGAEQFWLLESGFDRALAKSHLICCDSPAEIDIVQRRVADCFAEYVPIGVDVDRFCHSGTQRMKQILMIADFAEPRKRVELGLAAMARFALRHPDFRFVIGGRGSDAIDFPEGLSGSMDRVGFVTPKQLVALYQSSAAFLLLSDYEAFCIPIVESLVCGTPVVTNATEELLSLYRGQAGCYLASNLDDRGVDEALDKAIANTAHDEISSAARARFGMDTAFRMKLEAIARMMANITE